MPRKLPGLVDHLVLDRLHVGDEEADGRRREVEVDADVAAARPRPSPSPSPCAARTRAACWPTSTR
eukprot:130132-Hanusia_phi.AAC.1